MSETNVVDLPWIPVVRDGHEQRVSLRTALCEAHQIDRLSPSLLPVEREAMLRLLESTGAAVLVGQEPDDVEEARRFDPDLVDDFFARFGDRFDLADPDRPFLQEWHTAQRARKPDPKHWRDLKQLHLRHRGDSSSQWGIIPEHRPADDPAMLAALLAVSWFHGKPSNAAGAEFYRPTSGTKRLCVAGAPSGDVRDTTFHLLGRNLAETLLHNIPASWLTTSDLPAWLDQDAEPTAKRYTTPGTLWRCTWTPNRALVAWDAGRPRQFTRGLTQRFIPPLAPASSTTSPMELMKAHCKAVAAGDYCRIVPEAADGKSPKRITAPWDLLTAAGYEHWYRDGLAAAVDHWVRIPRVLPVDRDTRLGFHNEKGDTYGNREVSVWTEIPLQSTMITGPEATALRIVMNRVNHLISQIPRALDTLLHEVEPVHEVKRQVYSALDGPVLRAVAAAGDGVVVDTGALDRDMTTRARDGFDAATEPLITPATVAAVYQARKSYRRLTPVKPADERSSL